MGSEEGEEGDHRGVTELRIQKIPRSLPRTGQQTTGRGLILLTKLDWDTATPVCLHPVCGCFLITTA